MFSEPIVPCCSSQTCSPALLDRVKVHKSSLPASSKTKKAPKKGVPHVPTQERLWDWRMQVWARDCLDSSWGPSGLLHDTHIDFLSSIGSISAEALGQLFSHRWGWWNTYGDELSKLICSLDIPYEAIPAKPRAKKRKAPDTDPAPNPALAPPHQQTARRVRPKIAPTIPPSPLTQRPAQIGTILRPISLHSD